MFLGLFFLVRFGNCEKSVLIIGGDYNVTTKTAELQTMEQFFPSNLSTGMITTIDIPKEKFTQINIHTAPINATHAFVLPGRRPNSYTYYIDQTGIITLGPAVIPRNGAGLTSIPGKNGHMIPIYCGGTQWDVETRREGDYSPDCQMLSADGQRFELHSKMLEKYIWASLTTFGDMLIAIGEKRNNRSTTERYDGDHWRSGQHPTVDRYDSAWVKLNETALLTCGDSENQKKCLIYHVDKDKWAKAPDMKASGYEAEMVLIGQTVYAFGGSMSRRIQTLDMSSGVESAEWKLESVKLQRLRFVFGVWVIDSSNEPVTSRWSAVSVIFLILLLSIVILLLYFIIGVLYRRFLVDARGIQQLPNHSFWLKIYRRSHYFWSTRIARQVGFSTVSENYNRF